ncbi:MAG: hypothetical protein LBI42_01170 [Chitinispirillales bacterium]|jgi:hypothetical protein|nr:hypothetical protein [Chitinispirillales bacterium]
MKKTKFPIAAIAAAVIPLLFLNLCSCSKSAEDGGKKKLQAAVDPLVQLEKIKNSLESQSAPSAIGVAVSSDEMVARHMSTDEARAQLAKSIENLAGFAVYKSITRYNDEDKVYRVYTLVIPDPPSGHTHHAGCAHQH